MADELAQAKAAYDLANQHYATVVGSTNDKTQHMAAQRGVDAALARISSLRSQQQANTPTPSPGAPAAAPAKTPWQMLTGQ